MRRITCLSGIGVDDERWDWRQHAPLRRAFLCRIAGPDRGVASRHAVACAAPFRARTGIGGVALAWGVTDVPLTYAPPAKDAAELRFVQQDKPDGPDLVRCFAQAEPARQLPNLQKMPVLVVTSEASYHAPYDHCTVKYLRQAGVHASWIKLSERGIRGNSHVMMMEKNSKQISATIIAWANKAIPR